MASVFGYGSLVNLATHEFSAPCKAILRDHRRHWVQSGDRQVAFLSVCPAPGSDIAGLITEVPGNAWDALDLREAAYTRRDLTPSCYKVTETAQNPALPVRLYRADAAQVHVPSAPRPILMSYLDVVVQGFHLHFGAQGLTDFAATTDGWDTPVLDDRAAPRYPRAQTLSEVDRALTDQLLRDLGANVVSETTPSAKASDTSGSDRRR